MRSSGAGADNRMLDVSGLKQDNVAALPLPATAAFIAPASVYVPVIGIEFA